VDPRAGLDDLERRKCLTLMGPASESTPDIYRATQRTKYLLKEFTGNPY
jgi:hypothetical protein